mgnify:CR=1 FL=1
MIERLVRTLFTVRYPYANTLLRQRAWGLLIMAWMSLIGWVIYTFGVAGPKIAEGINAQAVTSPGLMALPIASIFTLYAVQTGSLRVAALIFTISLLIATIPLHYTSPENMLPLAVIPALVAGGVLLRRSQFVIVAALVIAALIARAFWLSSVAEPYVYIPANNLDVLLIVPTVALGLAAVFLYVFSGSIERVTAGALDQTRYLRAAIEHTAESDLSSPTTILNDLIRRLQDGYGFFNVRAYLVDDEGRLTRHLYLAPTGRALESRLFSSSEDLLAEEAAKLRQIVIADRNHPQALRTFVVPPVKKALALPLIDGDVLLAVVEAQSDQSRPFTAVELETLALLARSSARMLGTGGRLNTLQSSIGDAQTSLGRMAEQLRLLEGERAAGLRQGWDDYLRSRAPQTLGVESGTLPDGMQTWRIGDLPAALRETIQAGETWLDRSGSAPVLYLPVAFRGELLGAMSFVLPSDHQPTERQMELARGIAERLGAALDNARLLEQSRMQSERESRANLVGQRLLGVTDVQAVLDRAADEFRSALGAVYTRVEVQIAAEDANRTPEETS